MGLQFYNINSPVYGKPRNRVSDINKSTTLKKKYLKYYKAGGSLTADNLTFSVR